jgi:LysR family transcriptional regulator, glycine cleavage system transcriptional activator
MHGRPPLLSLEYFVTTARQGTVRAAAERLNVTPSAVSHQIARLEEFLDIHLFNRYKRRLILTDAGKQYVEQVEAALDRIGYATRDVATRGRRRRLTVSIPPTFLTFWLMPRLDRLTASYPDLDLRFVDALTIDLSRDDIDCGIEYCLSANAHLKPEKLFDDQVMPLASPDYIEGKGITKLEDVRGCTLIDTERRPWSWSNVLRRFSWRNECRTLTVQYTYQALTAASLGHGVALANWQNADWLILRGRVKVPFVFDDVLRDGPSYFFSCAPQNAASPTVRLFREWLFNERRRRAFGGKRDAVNTRTTRRRRPGTDS